MGTGLRWESYGKCPMEWDGWDSTHCISHGTHGTVVKKVPELTELSLSETVDE